MPTFYELDSARASAREHWWGCKGNLLAYAIVMVLKLLRIRSPVASDDANVDSTLPFVVESLPPAIMQRFGPLDAALSALGFLDPVYHEIDDPGSQSRTYWATYRHASGQYCARIHNRYWDRCQKKERALFLLFFTSFGDGTFLFSSPARPDVAAPRAVEMNRLPGTKVAALWDSHKRLVEARSRERTISSIPERDAVIDASERLHLLQRDFHLQRGFFRERSVQEAERAQAFVTTAETARAEGSPYPEVIAEIGRLEEQKPRWSQGLWVLGLSLLAFLAAGSARWNWDMTLWLVPILFFHETGHWVAMRAFRYRNMRMFFIPLFGAAVTGQNRNVPGWKKAVVSLAGPLPGIALGVLCEVIALFTGAKWLGKGAVLLILLNGFNLVPVLPLDGGQFLQTTLFCRNRWLNIVFRVVAIVGLFLLTIAGWGRFLIYIGIVLALGLPAAFKISKIIDQFRAQPLPPPPPEEDRIPRPTAETLIAAVKSEFPSVGNRIVAQNVLNIYETLNARPPGLAATAGLLSLYGGAILVAVFFIFASVIGKNGGLGEFVRNALTLPRHKVEMASVEVWRGAEAGAQAPNTRNHVLTTFTLPTEARKEFQQSVQTLPPKATALLFGDSFMVGLPQSDADISQQWFDRLHTQSTNTLLLTNDVVCLALSFYAPTSQASTNLEESLQDLCASGLTNLVPPWDPVVASTDFARHLEARRVWRRINGQLEGVFNDSIAAFLPRVTEAMKRRDTNELKRIGDEKWKSLLQLQEQARLRLTKDYAATPFSSLVDCEAQLSRCNPTNETQRAEILAKIADPLGCVPAGHEGSILQSGGLLRRGLQFRLPFVVLADPETNLPEILQWLTKQGCSHIRYQFQAYDANADDSDN